MVVTPWQTACLPSEVLGSTRSRGGKGSTDRNILTAADYMKQTSQTICVRILRQEDHLSPQFTRIDNIARPHLNQSIKLDNAYKMVRSQTQSQHFVKCTSWGKRESGDKNRPSYLKHQSLS
ncbi:hypothetical protein I79_021369 [Cricetulus griseus]|uniref:Uncharacterized protein n=1 Tax=Cricetulus griseus TaxID=10029 RepID=G3ICH1_CRIGR|nr:hypothetical protein I79_021369 [Cricetulus griseus]